MIASAIGLTGTLSSHSLPNLIFKTKLLRNNCQGITRKFGQNFVKGFYYMYKLYSIMSKSYGSYSTPGAAQVAHAIIPKTIKGMDLLQFCRTSVWLDS